MYIVQIASECAPVAKVGGLGDVVCGLSRELRMRGNRVEVILPKYDCMRYDRIRGLQKVYHDLWVPWYSGSIHCSVWHGEVHGIDGYFIDAHSRDNFFNRSIFYGCDDEEKRFSFFSKAALEFLLKTNRRPEVIHCHDWQTGIVPAPGPNRKGEFTFLRKSHQTRRLPAGIPIPQRAVSPPDFSNELLSLLGTGSLDRLRQGNLPEGLRDSCTRFLTRSRAIKGCVPTPEHH
jgi:glycosyltransferase involved in cell wall biosynthesis